MSRISIFTLLLFLHFTSFSQNISISSDSNSLIEGGATDIVMVSATLDVTAESSIKIPITLAGNASKSDDYLVSFSTYLNTTTLYSINADYRRIISLTDGRFIIYETGTNNIKIIDFEDQSTQVDVSLARNYNYIKASNDLILGVTNNQIYQLSISGDTVSESLYHELLGSQGSFNNQISIEGSNVLFNTLENNGERNVYLKQGSNDPEQIYSGNSCCWVPLLYQGRALMFAENGDYFNEIVNNSYTENLYLASSLSPYDIKVFNDKIYAKPYGWIDEPTILEVNIDAAEVMDAMSIPSPLTLTNVIPTGDPYAMGFDHGNHDFTFDSLGNLIHISKIKQKINLPILCKDFFVDKFQVHLSRSYGADAILIILAGVDEKTADELYEEAEKLKMSVIVEVHTVEEAKKSLKYKDALIGINNRNLKTLKTDINTTYDIHNILINHRGPLISESGIKNKEDVLKIVSETKIKTFLIGESILKNLKNNNIFSII